VTFLRSATLRRASVAVAALLAGVVAPAKADFTIDDFSAPNPGVVYDAPGAVGGTTALGGGLTRSAFVTLLSGNSVSGVLGTDTRPSPLGTVFEQSTPASATAYSQLAYNYGSTQNWAATGVSGLSLSFSFADLSVPYTLVLRDDTGGTSTLTGTVVGANTYANPFSSFTGSADLTRIAGFDVYLNRNTVAGVSATSADFVLDTVSANQSNPVPAPPAALLALAALPALALRRKLRAKAAA